MRARLQAVCFKYKFKYLQRSTATVLNVVDCTRSNSDSFLFNANNIFRKSRLRDILVTLLNVVVVVVVSNALDTVCEKELEKCKE